MHTWTQKSASIQPRTSRLKSGPQSAPDPPSCPLGRLNSHGHREVVGAGNLAHVGHRHPPAYPSSSPGVNALTLRSSTQRQTKTKLAHCNSLIFKYNPENVSRDGKRWKECNWIQRCYQQEEEENELKRSSQNTLEPSVSYLRKKSDE